MEKNTKVTSGNTESPYTNRITKEKSNRRRDEQNQAIIDDLCDIVIDLFISEYFIFVVNDKTDECQVELR